jgi:DNA ligase D-like protein (predicted polymerase)
VRTVSLWSESSRRDVNYALCDDRRTLLWFANQRAVEYHPTLVRATQPESPTHLVIDIDPPEDGAFSMAVRAAHLVGEALSELKLAGAVKTSGSKGVHIYVPVRGKPSMPDAAAATRAIAERAARLDPTIATTAFMKQDRGGKVFIDATRVGWASVVSAYSPRVRPGTPVSFPVAWDDLDDVSPGDFTIHTVIALLGDRDPWADALPAPQALDPALVEEGDSIPGGRVQAMHEGKRRARARRASEDQ